MNRNKQSLSVIGRNLLYLLAFFFSIVAIAQKTVTGIVSDSNGPLPGVNILVKNTTNGTQTDFNGNYTIDNVSKENVLIFSFVGYQTQEIQVINNTIINVILQEDTQSLDEVVVIGYGTSRKSDLTGALASVSAKDFEKQPLNDVSQALQGRAAGVQVTQTSGAPGGNFRIRIRGANSITGGNNPLYVVDGQFVDIFTVNVNDIASMEVLKDASATAIYGTRGANGVVLISTKTGRPGKAKISVDLFSGFSNVTQKLDLMSAVEFAEGVNFSDDDIIFTDDEDRRFTPKWGRRLARAPLSNRVF